ncbi:golgin subfamily A member 5, partial [Austrofundulus limnaeus]|uniref:Golgin subfamily A member 5 n=1 Tax=Austrofundulus limnaeus TaxID=52670 RepID=A0A2I4AL13_AUSLI
MSWFTDLAGRAEDFLNKVDQGAATALSKNQTRTSSYREECSVTNQFSSAEYQSEQTGTHHTYTASHEASGFISAAAGNIKRASAGATMLAGTASVPITAPVSDTSASNSTKTSAGFVRPRKSEQDVDDDMLFNFLNSSDPPAASRRDSRREHGKMTPSTTEAPNPTPPPPTTPLTIPSVPSTPR